QGERATLEVKNSAGIIQKEEMIVSAREKATAHLLDALTFGKASVLSNKSEIAVVGHRIVNGGRDYTQPVTITPEVKAAIQRMAVFAPLHNRVNSKASDSS